MKPRESDLARSLIRWFRLNRRDLPWRQTPRDPYRALVSEVMLHQTQVSRVAEVFPRFIARFPDVYTLAQAPEHEVLEAWAGLGYYRRARLLHHSAKEIVERFNGSVPSDAHVLRSLPGVGRYTAGAIASIVFDRPEPIVDGNVARVLFRIHGREGSPTTPPNQKWVWDSAAALVKAARLPGEFNEGLMELGATVCTPARPVCGQCPWAAECAAKLLGRQDEIPWPRPRTARRSITLSCLLLHDTRGRVLLERANSHGLWGGLWRLPSVDGGLKGQALLASLGLSPSARRATSGLAWAGIVRRDLTHRRVSLHVWTARTTATRADRNRKWFDAASLDSTGIASAYRAALRMGLAHAITAKQPRRKARPTAM